jgi:hypothetical protein
VFGVKGLDMQCWKQWFVIAQSYQQIQMEYAVLSNIMRQGNFFNLCNIRQAILEAKDLMTKNKIREKIRLRGVEHIKVHFSLDKYAS